MSGQTEPIAGSESGGVSPVDEAVVEVHRQHLQDHRYVQEYGSVGEYFEQERGLEDVAAGYYDVPPHAAFRIHTYAPRDYMVLQSNPDLWDGVATGSVHWSYRELSGDLDESVREHVLHSSQNVTPYFNDNDSVRLGIKSIIGAVQSELDCSFEGSALRQADYEEYLQETATQAYEDGSEDDGVDLGAGFHGDFAYSNRCKFQADGSTADPTSADDEWLEEELAVIAPKVVFALGRPAYEGLRSLGFEKTGERSKYSDAKTGRVLRYEGDQSELDGMYAVHMYHLDYRRDLTIDRDVHDALRALKEVADSI